MALLADQYAGPEFYAGYSFDTMTAAECGIRLRVEVTRDELLKLMREPPDFTTAAMFHPRVGP